MTTEPETTDFQAIQDELVRGMRQFADENPEIMEAMEVMNLSVADYIQAMDSIRGIETVSCSGLSDLPTQVAIEIGY